MDGSTKLAKVGHLVIVEWVDSAYALGWLTSRDEDEPQLKKCKSVGWVRRQTKDMITLTSNTTIEEYPQRCCEISIPLAAVTRVHLLRI